MSKNASQIAEELFESIQTLIDATVANIKIDSTEICTVISKPKTTGNPYQLTTESANIIEAYAESGSYNVKDEVVVLFPKDDTKKKTILSKYVSGDNTTNSFVSVDETFAAVATASVPDSFQFTFALDADNNVVPTGAAQEMTIDDESLRKIYHQVSRFNAFHLSTIVDASGFGDAPETTYGLIVEIATNSTKLSFKLDSDNMLGNPYAFD